MIVQTLEISMSKGRAADILAHVGEDGREIEFIPDVELSADDHTAEIDTVKPDGTFTMTTCSIDENGHIIAPITQQAVAVKGLCHYIIKIYNDDVVIYSACGSLWVDDHLITDDMIESIAEVNGYRFPQDFATLDDIPGADDFIDDNAVETDKTWSSDKINTELSQIQNLDVYTTSERVVGVWTDNRPVYERIYKFTISSGNDYVVDNTMSATDNELIPDSNILLYIPDGWNVYYSNCISASALGRLVLGTSLLFNMIGYSSSYGTINVTIRCRYLKASDL